MSSLLEKVRLCTEQDAGQAERPEQLPSVPVIGANEERSAFAVAYALFYVAGFLLGLLVGWLLWKH
jgi:hypothetical protein